MPNKHWKPEFKCFISFKGFKCFKGFKGFKGPGGVPEAELALEA